MLVFVIPSAWLVAMCFGLAACRLAAISDESDTAALKEWLAASRLADQLPSRGEDPVQHDHRRGGYRATG